MDEMLQEQLLKFFKVFANVDRIKIAGLVGVRPATTSQLAEALQMRQADVASQLDRLVDAKLIQHDHSGIYRFDTVALEAMSRQILSQARPRVQADDFEGDDFDRKVLSDFMLPGGRLKSLPMQQKKLQAVLRHTVKLFAAGERYTEKQVNDVLRQIYDDPASLRRYLIDDGFMGREKGIYWRL